MGIIYCIINNITGKIYIGKTSKDLEIRKRNHEYNINRYDGFLQRAFKKYGFKNFSWKILDKTEDPIELNRLEQDYICMFGSSFKKLGYNMTEGGEGGLPNAEVLQKYKRNNTGIQNPNYGKTPSEYTRKKLRDWQLGEKSPKFGKPCSSKSKEKCSKPVMCKETSIVYCSIREAMKQTGIDRASLSRCCQGKQVTAGKQHWSYT
jgi:group I intron endonuclease